VTIFGSGCWMSSSVATTHREQQPSISTRWKTLRSTSTARPSAGPKPHPGVPGSSVSRPEAVAPDYPEPLFALRFFFVKTLRDRICPMRFLSEVSPEAADCTESGRSCRLIDSARNLMHRTMLMTLYATGLRRSELCHLKVSDIDSERMVIHVQQGKGSRDRDVLLTRSCWRPCASTGAG